jgi:hypothetical protein
MDRDIFPRDKLCGEFPFSSISFLTSLCMQPASAGDRTSTEIARSDRYVLIARL